MTLAYEVTYRGFPSCPCLAAWIPAYEGELIRRGAIRETVDIAQLIGNAPASAGVHSTGGCGDIWQHEPVFQDVAREMGAAAWNRLWDDNEHTHWVLNGCPHNGPARYQIAALAAGYDGTGYLGRGAPDYGPGPRVLRTWREGIKWAQQQEDNMAFTDWPEKDQDELVNRVAAAVAKKLLDTDLTPKQDEPRSTVRAALNRILKP